MSEQNKKPSPSETASTEVVQMNTAAPIVGLDPRLIDLLIADKAEEALARKSKREHVARKAEASRQGAAVSQQAIVAQIQNCCIAGHQKGGRTRKRNAADDINVAVHQFIGTEYRAKFLCCPFFVWGPRERGKVPADTREIVWRDRGDGWQQEPNPSYNPARGLPGISFADAMLLANTKTSNVMSKSETVFDNPAVKANTLEAENAALKAKLAMLETSTK